MIPYFRRIRGVALLAAALGIAACSDATSPESGNGPAFKVTVNEMAPDSTSATFTVTRSGGTFTMGKHSINFPGNAICDPEKSTYGVGTWDQPCRTLRQSITIRAEVRKIDGKEWVDFTPSLRFSPDKEVYIWMYTDQVMAQADSKALNILWAPYFGAEGVDESLDDPTLVTGYLPQYKIVYRRIKHFSGYMVASGRTGYADDAATTTTTEEGMTTTEGL